FTLDPKGAVIRLRIDQTGEEFEFAAGDSLDLVFPEGFEEITLTPTILLEEPDFTTIIDALASPLIDVSAIGVTLFGIPLTLIDPPPYHLVDFAHNLKRTTFALGGFEDFTGDPIRLSLNQRQAVPVPSTLVLLVFGLVAAGVGGARRKR
ncbi:MAG TPA: PEP-CTERM sorting domain-containing protein, partial [Candidatus Eisenbacteria bacterium]|nr:PEP-CTERM sorting domain-containing protein [Candidatus Eisenbacteria bacterium]